MKQIIVNMKPEKKAEKKSRALHLTLLRQYLIADNIYFWSENSSEMVLLV